MLKVNKVAVEEAGGCSFCRRGTLRKLEFGLEYPYTHVLVVESPSDVSSSVSVRMCGSCVGDLLLAVRTNSKKDGV